MKKTSINRALKYAALCVGVSLFCSTALSKPAVRAFRADYDSVWKSTLIALAKYPLDKNDKSSGEISTTVIDAEQVFKPYKKKARSNERYKLEISLEKRKVRGQKITVVKVHKRPLIKGDFMNRDIELKSDGIEESVLLYRIARELVIDKAVERAFK